MLASVAGPFAPDAQILTTHCVRAGGQRTEYAVEARLHASPPHFAQSNRCTGPRLCGRRIVDSELECDSAAGDTVCRNATVERHFDG